jgi:hopene-associated glycosyltransferase HpnB
VRILASAALLAWVFLALGRGWFWRTDVRLAVPAEQPAAPDPAPQPSVSWPSVAVVVPARDEAEVLPLALPTLAAQRYSGRLRLILADDGSTDGTGDLARQLGAYVVSPGEPPPGWAGKLWALRAGVAEAGEVDFLLLTDADIAHPPDSVAAMVRVARAHRLDLVSQMARLRTRTGWERLVVPAFVYFFAMLYPFRWVNRAGARTAAAAGGCVLVRREVLVRAGGLDAIRGAVIDDVALGRAVKRAGGRIYLGLAERVESVRPYPDLASLWHMVARSAYAQLRHSVALLAGTVLGLGIVFIGPPLSTVVGAVTGDLAVLLAGAAAWLLMAATFAPMLRYYRQPVVLAALLPFTATLYLAMTVDSALRHYRGRGAAWKGRTYQ